MKTKLTLLTILGGASLFALAQLQPGNGSSGNAAGNPPVAAPGQPPVGAPANPPVGAPGNPPGVVPGNGIDHINPETPPNNGADNDAKNWHGSGNFNNNGVWHGSGSMNTNSPWHGSGDFNNHGSSGVVTNQ